MVLDFLGNIGIDDIASLATGAANLFRGDQERVVESLPTDGFNLLPPEVQARALQAFNTISEAPRPSIPMRRMTQQEMQSGSIFVNPALKALQQYKDMKAGEKQAEAQAMEPEVAPASISQVDDALMRGYAEAQRIASAPSTPKGMTAEQLRQYMKDAQMGMAPNQAQALLDPSSQGYENPFTRATIDRETILRELGNVGLVGNPMNVRYGGDVGERMQARDEAIQAFRNRMKGINYQPPKTSVGRIFGSTILPAIGMAAFTGGVGIPASAAGAGATSHIGAYNAANAVNNLKNVTGLMNAAGTLRGTA